MLKSSESEKNLNSPTFPIRKSQVILPELGQESFGKINSVRNQIQKIEKKSSLVTQLSECSNCLKIAQILDLFSMNQIIYRIKQLILMEKAYNLTKRDTNKSEDIIMAYQQADKHKIFELKNPRQIKVINRANKKGLTLETLEREEHNYSNFIRTIDNNCVLCDNRIEDDQLTLNCQHNYHKNCLVHFINTQINNRLITIQCKCRAKIPETYMRSIGVDIDNLKKEQLELIRKKHQKNILQCNKCGFFFIYNQRSLIKHISCPYH